MQDGSHKNLKSIPLWAGGLFTFCLLIFFLVEAFAGPLMRHGMRQRSHHHDLHHGGGFGGGGICPQKRVTLQAPDEFLNMKNPLKKNSENIFAGEALFQTDAHPTACKVCHGPTGNGFGMMAQGLNPPPRNFTCVETMQVISDGQLFWVIKYGSPGTGMPAYKELADHQVWQVVHYLRSLSKGSN